MRKLRLLLPMRTILTRSFICCLIVFSTVAAAEVSALGQASKIHVIPRPRQMEVSQVRFQLSTGATIALADPRSEDDRFAAQDFIDDLKETSGVQLRLGKSRKRAILIGLIEQPAVRAGLK